MNIPFFFSKPSVGAGARQGRIAAVVGLLLAALTASEAAEPPAVNPFIPSPSQREDAVPGCVELSDGSIHAGLIYLTRDKRLQIYDQQLQRQREVPLRQVKLIECTVKKEWMEKEWRFKESASDEKIYTGRSYPAREYLHAITLLDGGTITGPLSAVVYVQPQSHDLARPDEDRKQPEAERFLLHKRDKGEPGKDLKSLVYVRRIKLGKDALEAGKGTEDAKRERGRKQGLGIRD